MENLENENLEKTQEVKENQDFDYKKYREERIKNRVEKSIFKDLGVQNLDEIKEKFSLIDSYKTQIQNLEEKAKELETLTNETSTLKSAIAEKEAIITAITKATGKKTDDVLKIVKMAKGLVDENTTMEQALEQVFALSGNAKTEPPKTTPTGTPPAEPSADNPESNPFDKKTLNYTEQGRIFKENPAKARALYKAATGKDAPF